MHGAKRAVTLIVLLPSIVLGCKERPASDGASSSPGRLMGAESAGSAVAARDEAGNEFTLLSNAVSPPEDWPKDIPLFPGASLKSSGQSERARTLVLNVSAEPDEVLDFYEKRLPAMKRRSWRAVSQGKVLVLQDERNERKVMVAVRRRGAGRASVRLAVSRGAAPD